MTTKIVLSEYIYETLPSQLKIEYEHYFQITSIIKNIPNNTL